MAKVGKVMSTKGTGRLAARAVAATLMGVVLACGQAAAGVIDGGQLVVVRAGDGAAALGSGAAPLFLDIYDPSGTPPLTPVQTIALPTGASGDQRRCTGLGSAGQTTILTQSGDGRYLVLTGYNAAVGASIGTTIERVIARIGLDGTIDTSTTTGPTATSGVYVGITGGAIRGAVTIDGSAYWTTGLTSAGGTTTRGLHYTTHGSTVSPVQIHATAAPGGGLIDAYAGQLFCSLAAGTASTVNTVGTGMPTSLATMTPIVTTPVTQSINEFFFADPQTLYIAESTAGTAATAGIEKWTLQNGVWTFAYRLMNDGVSGTRCSTLTGIVSGGQVTLYTVESGTNALNGVAVRRVVDAGPGSVSELLLSAPTNTGLRGIRLVAAAGACCNEGTQACTSTTAAGCPAGSTFFGPGTACQATPCGGQPTGVCCRGATCSTTVTAGECAGSGTAGAVFIAEAAVCNSGSSATPCCYADYNKTGGVTVQDLFDFLSDYFNGSPNANVGGDGSGGAPGVQSIFDYLAAYFGGGC